MSTNSLEISPNENSQADPNLALSDGGGTRYPNQFFDMSQQYMPPTIKELFRWCTFYFYNSPLIGSAIKKISRYPITDLVFEDHQESPKEIWEQILVKELRLKDRLMEVNLDYHVYGNAFVSIHLPFTRFLICQECGHRQPIQQWKWTFRGVGAYHFEGTCEECNVSGPVKVKDIPYKDRKGVRLIRWNPENIHIKFNEYTGRYIYMYSVPGKLRRAIERCDKDVLEDIPLVVIQALRDRKMIRLNNNSIKHLKNPTLAEQDQGWGKPTIIHVLKDMYYLYTLRRAQEAIALEHIIPFDIIYPMPNAQQDPYIHTDLADWKNQINNVIQKHRKDPNFKAVIPIPVGFGRLGGDGKALLLSPELNYLTQTIVGGMGVPQEFVFGGLNYTGSSISLRTLENDFIQNRSQLLDLTLWIKDKIRIWLNIPDCKTIKFADFRMADDVQRHQQLIGLNAQGKVSDHTLLTELGYDYEQETKKKIEEIYIQNYINDLQTKGGAKSQGEAQLIQFNYQQKLQELQQKAQEEAQEKMRKAGVPPEQAMMATQPGMEGQQQMAAGQPGAQTGAEGMAQEAGGAMAQGQGQAPAGATADPSGQSGAVQQIDSRVERWATQLASLPTGQAKKAIAEIRAKMPAIGQKLEVAYEQKLMELAGGGAAEPSMEPMPEQRAPTRSEVTGGG